MQVQKASEEAPDVALRVLVGLFGVLCEVALRLRLL